MLLFILSVGLKKKNPGGYYLGVYFDTEYVPREGALVVESFDKK